MQTATEKPGILWSIKGDQLIKAENRQQNEPSRTIIQLYPLAGSIGAESPGVCSGY
jgi:hypothetical protein